MYYALDTNIILLDANNVLTVVQDKENDAVVIPVTVLDEIDSKKSVLGEIGFQAREFGRILTRGQLIQKKHVYGIDIVEYEIDHVKIMIISEKNVDDKFDLFDKNVINDRLIISVIKEFSKLFRNDVVFITNDVACRIRAESEGLVVKQLKDTSDTQVDFHKELEVSDEVFRSLHGKNINEIDTEYVKANYNYTFINSVTRQQKIAVVKNAVVHIIGKETEQELRKQEIVPVNKGQLFLSKAIQDNTVDLVVVEALSGSGKTIVSLSNAIKLVKTNSPYKGILYIRASINDEDQVEQVGFLKGGLEEKNEIYFYPAIDAITNIAKKRLNGTKLKGKEYEDKLQDTVDKIIEDCNIQMLTGLGMRGRTFEDVVVVIDEVQNMSKSSLRKVLTRFGKNCKVIVVGSNRQIDNPYVTKYTNGLSVLLDAATKEQEINIHVVQLTKVVRSQFAEFAEYIFEGK